MKRENKIKSTVNDLDNFVLGTLSSSLVLLNTRVVLLSNPKDLSS